MRWLFKSAYGYIDIESEWDFSNPLVHTILLLWEYLNHTNLLHIGKYFVKEGVNH